MAKTKRKDMPATTGTIADKTAEAAAAVVVLKAKAKKPAKPAAPSVHSKSTHVHKSNMAPTQEIAMQLQSAFDHFNQHLFHGKLQPCVLTLERLRKYVGYFRPKQWTTDRKAGALDGTHHQITLDPDRLSSKGDKVVLSTLAHEMAHQIVWDTTFAETGKFKRPYHCASWVLVMEAIGLKPVIVDKDGKKSDKKTGTNATHEIVKGGEFDRVATELIEKTGFKLDWLLVPVPEKKGGKAKQKAGVKVKYTCSCCENSVWGKGGMKFTCQDGGEDFVQEGGEEGSDE